MSRFIFVSPVSFEDWDHRSPDTTGIGGSETAHIETARRLAAMGHEVISYAPIPDDCPQFKDGVEWLHIDKADHSLPGIWVISRAPGYVHKLKNLGARQTPWLVCQDVDYSHRRGIRKERVDDYAAFDLIFALSPTQLDYLRAKYPELDRRFFLSRNGVRVDLIEEIEATGVERKPGKIIHTSSPDRGLMVALHIFKRVMEHVKEDVEFYTAYGFNNMLKTIDSVRSKVPEIEKHIQSLKNVTWGDRQTQRDLYRQYLESSHYLYITDFPETSCEPAGSLTFTKHGMRKIEDVKVGDLVLTHKGRFRAVTKLFQRQYDGPMFALKRKKDAFPIHLTAEHPVLVGTYEDHYKTRWVEAEQVKEDIEHGITPRMSFGTKTNILLSDYVDFPVVNGRIGPNHNNSHYKTVENNIPITQEFAYILGIFAADGCVSSARGREGKRKWYSTIAFAHHIKERNIAEGICEFFGSGKIKQISENGITTVLHNSVWANFLKKVIGTSVDKRIPDFIWDTSAEIQQVFLRGILDGDGYKSKTRNTDRYTSISPSLTYGVAQLLTNMGFFPSISYVENRRAYELSWQREEMKQPCHITKDNEITSRFESITHEEYHGPVYNFEVEEDHSYVTDRTIVHNCISCMEAQCMGAIPVVSSFWALKDYVRWGKNINGTVEHSLTLCKAAMGLAENIDKTFDTENHNMEEYRQNMMKWARQEFNWDRVAEQYHALATAEPDRSAEFLAEEYQRPPIISQHHSFQLMNATGKIINLGAGTDLAGLGKKKNALNVDLLDKEGSGLQLNQVDLKADIRQMPEDQHGQYDTVVLGDVLEHCYEEDGLKILREANECLKPGGKIVVTFPEDYRPPDKQHPTVHKDKTYVGDIKYAHRHDPPLTRKELFDWMHKADFMVRHCDPLNYRNVDIDVGWGVIGIAT